MAQKKEGSIQLDDVVLVTSVSKADINAATPGAGKVLAITGDGLSLEWISTGAGTSFASMTDVQLAGLAGGHIAIYDGASKWVNKALNGDVVVNSAGLVTIQNQVVSTAKLADAGITAVKLASAVADLFVSGSASADAEVANERVVHVTLTNLAGTTITTSKSICLEAIVVDSAGDLSPSSTATIVDAGNNTVMDGAGTARAFIAQDSADTYKVRFKVAFTGAGTKYVLFRTGFGSGALLYNQVVATVAFT